LNRYAVSKLIIQLQLDLNIGTQLQTLSPTLDKATVLQLRTIGVTYLSTHWSSYWKEWEHRIIVTTERGHQHTLTKNDQGIAALLRKQQ
jgi:hypothetical protein